MSSVHLTVPINHLKGICLLLWKSRIEAHGRDSNQVVSCKFGLKRWQGCNFSVSIKGHAEDIFATHAFFNEANDVNDLSSIERLAGSFQDHALANAPFSQLVHLPNNQEATTDDFSTLALQQRDSFIADQGDAVDDTNFNVRPNECVNQAATQTEVQQEEGSLIYSHGETSESSAPQSVAFHKAKRLFDHVWESVKKLERDLSEREEELDSIAMGMCEDPSTFSKEGVDYIKYGDDLQKAERKIKRLELELTRMYTELVLKDRSIALASSELRHAEEKLKEAEILVLTVKRMREEMQVRQSEHSSLEEMFSFGQQILEEQSDIDKAFDIAEEKVSSFHTLVLQLSDDLNFGNSLFDIFQKEAMISSQALLLATQALDEAEKQMLALKDSSRRDLEALFEEREAVTSLRVSLQRREHDLRVENEKAEALVAEMSSLKALLDNKDMLVENMQEEAKQNKALLACAAKNTEGLNQAQKKIEQLTAQVKAMEEQLISRDVLLEEVRDETFKSTEALKLATQIKQDLNLSRQKEMELAQELDSQVALVKELHQELTENSRAVRAEQALRQMEKGLKDLTVEVDILRKGAQERDDAIRVMKDEVDKNILILSNAAESREIMRKMQLHINDLEAKLKDGKPSKLNREKAVPGKAMKQNSNSSATSISNVASPLPKVPKLEGKPLQQRHSRFD